MNIRPELTIVIPAKNEALEPAYTADIFEQAGLPAAGCYQSIRC